MNKLTKITKLTTDAPHTLNINQATSDVIILYNDDGTKVIMVLENGEWKQARTGTTPTLDINQGRKVKGEKQ